jgi:hypothetical protein
VVRVAEQPFRVAHLGDVGQVALEPGDRHRVFPLHGDLHEHLEPEPDRSGVDDSPTGVSSGTWILILGELSCWLLFGWHESDPRLITLGVTGVTASALMLARIYRTTKRGQSARTPAPA